MKAVSDSQIYVQQQQCMHFSYNPTYQMDKDDFLTLFKLM